ncbi:MAG TPA: hypothetical protein VJZ00_03745, partial [Thermoanaerobaculia bacterium]|nr:hypothetical protein [Thermoanaerobaculia bacterium]
MNDEHATAESHRSSFIVHRYDISANEQRTERVVQGMKNSWIGGTSARLAETAEENLAVAVHRAEPGALERLIDRFESALYSYAYGILQNPFDAQEVV